MSTIVTMTLDDVKNLPPITEERKKEMDSFVNTDFSDNPKMSKEELSQFKPWYELHPEWVKVKKGDIHTKIDLDLLAMLKKGGKGYQKRLNQALRWAFENNCPYLNV